jgi:hypothetical protein
MDYKYIKKELKVNVDWYEVEGGEDHFLTIYKLPYNDIDIYNVLMVDAYRTPTSKIMTKEAIKEKYGIEV